jgi:hypothetical protein
MQATESHMQNLKEHSWENKLSLLSNSYFEQYLEHLVITGSVSLGGVKSCELVRCVCCLFLETQSIEISLSKGFLVYKAPFNCILLIYYY